MSTAPAAVREILERLPELLPTEAPGLSARDVHKVLDTWAAGTVRVALVVFERDGHAVSELAPGRRNQPTRYFRLARPEATQS